LLRAAPEAVAEEEVQIIVFQVMAPVAAKME